MALEWVKWATKSSAIGVTWQVIGTVPASTAWVDVDVDLTAFQVTAEVDLVYVQLVDDTGATLARSFPLAAVGFSDFWRRWHISLSTWLRDYLYIPLGGNRGTEVRTYVNLMLTMLLGGLWHGASWNYVIWGAYHGVLLALARIIGFARRRIAR